MILDEDLNLVRHFLTGDRAAFERIVEKYQKTVFNVALRMTHEAGDAEDIAQEVFLKAYERLKSFKPEYKFFSWLYRIAVNESLNFLEQKKRYQVLDEQMAAGGPELDDVVEASERSRKIQDAMMKLNVDHRAVIVLKHFEGLSYEEIAQVLEITEKKVKSRLFTARQVLRDILAKKGFGSND
jgi:RNA polymerase sigma-70 factor (ECF subfamily)